MDSSETQKAIDLLKNGRTSGDRLRGARKLLEHGGADGIMQLLHIKKDEKDSEVSATIEKFLLEKGIVIDMSPFLVDDWFDSMVSTIEGFEEVCDLVGYRFVAFAMITGINMRAVNHNPESPSESTVEFTIGSDESVTELPLEEFRRTLMISILSPDADEPIREPRPSSRDDITQLLGARYFLLAPIYTMKLDRLIVLDPPKGREGYIIEGKIDGRDFEWTIPEFREKLRKLVSDEAVKEKEPVGRFTTESIAFAEKSLEAGNPAGALEQLRDWILFVRNYRISGGIAQLMQEPDAHFERGLLLTGRAYRLLGRSRISEDILRFSIQLLPSSKTKPVFLYELAMIMIAEERFGEAIGPLRKALKLGIPKSLIFPLLGRALLECNRVVGAFLLFGELNREGLLDDADKHWYEESKKRLGDAFDILTAIPNQDSSMKEDDKAENGGELLKGSDLEC